MKHNFRIKLVLLILLIGSIGGAVEYRLRNAIWQANIEDPAIWNTILYSAPIQRQPNKIVSFRFYSKNPGPLASADIRLNNMGFISDRDYKYERGNNEYRIVVIGGEQTASSVATRSWPDYLEDELNRQDPLIHYKVFNIAWPDAGPEHYIQYWKEEGVRFSPDLVLVNYVESDFFRTLAGAPLTYRGMPISHSEIEYRVGPGDNDTAKTQTANLYGHSVKSFRDPEAVPARPYGFFVSAAFMREPGRVRSLQERVVNDMIEGAIPPFGSLTLEMLKARRVPAINVAEYRNFDPLPSQPIDKQKMIRFGVKNFGWLVDHIPNLILTHNFNLHEMSTRFEFTEAMQTENSHIHVLDMRTRIPKNASDDEVRSWYLPANVMPEKWSDKGHGMYAMAMAKVVRDWQAGKLSDQPKMTSTEYSGIHKVE